MRNEMQKMNCWRLRLSRPDNPLSAIRFSTPGRNLMRHLIAAILQIPAE